MPSCCSAGTWDEARSSIAEGSGPKIANGEQFVALPGDLHQPQLRAASPLLGIGFTGAAGETQAGGHRDNVPP